MHPIIDIHRCGHNFIINSFTRIPANADENEYYGAWNTVLNFCFNIEEGYEITPKKTVDKISAGGKNTVDFVVSYMNTKSKATLFFLEVREEKDLPGLYARQEADTQMRKHFAQLYDSLPSGLQMYSVSAFGSRVSFYLLDKRTKRIIPPCAAEPSAEFVSDTAPLELWNGDICQPDGYVRFMEVVNSAKAAGFGKRIFLVTRFW